MTIQELIDECNDKLERNLVSSAIQDLHDAAYQDIQIHQRSDIKLLYARLLGHIGELSETLRITNEISQDLSIQEDYQANSAVYSAMCWSRLMEFGKANEILHSTKTPTDNEYLVYYHCHLLSISFEIDDKLTMRKSLRNINQIIDKQNLDKIQLQELQIWKTIFATYIKKSFITQDVKKAEKVAVEIMNLSGKKSFAAYIHLRIGNLFERIPNLTKAIESYNTAKQKAIDGNHGIALIMINLALIRIEKEPGVKKKLIKETSVIVGQHGIGLIHCKLSYTLWKHIEQLNKADSLKCKQWLLTDRYLPDITRLTGDSFERLCYELIRSHGKDLFNTDIVVNKLPDREVIIDLEVKSTSVKNNINLGVQCKGGTRKWTESSLKNELDRKRPFESDLRDTINQFGCTGYVFICSSSIDVSGQKWLNRCHRAVFGIDCIVIDTNVILHYLTENPKLRMLVAMALNK